MPRISTAAPKQVSLSQQPPSTQEGMLKSVALKLGIADPSSIKVLLLSTTPHFYGSLFNGRVQLPDGRKLDVRGHDFWAIRTPGQDHTASATRITPAGRYEEAVVQQAVAEKLGIQDPRSVTVLTSAFKNSSHGYGGFSATVQLQDGKRLSVTGTDFWVTGSLSIDKTTPIN